MHPNVRWAQVKRVMAAHRAADNSQAAFHLVIPAILYGISLIWIVVLLESSDWSYRLAAMCPLYLLAGLCLTKIFTVQHDCGHNSFFENSRVNRWLGRACSLLTFVPFAAWKEEHLEHHASFGNVQQQTFGDAWLMTVDQFHSAPIYVKLTYRVFRSSLFLILVAPLGYLIIRQRFPSRIQRSRVVSAIAHTGSLLLLYGGLFALHGQTVLIVVLPSLYIAGLIAVLIFVIEHQFEGTVWTGENSWSFHEASVGASSYLSMPRWLEWFTGNIGYHHIHHLNPKVPSYRLRDCFYALGDTLPFKEISWRRVPQQLRLTLWSDEKQQLVGFSRRD